MSRTLPRRFAQEARCWNLNVLGRILSFHEESTDSSSALFSETSGQIDTTVAFSGRNARHQCSAKSSQASPEEKRVQKQSQSLATSDMPWWPVFHRLGSRQCFTSLRVSLVPWLPRPDLFCFTCTDTLCRFESAMKHLTSYLMGKPGTHVYLISLRWNSVVWALGPWPLSLVINGCQPRTAIYHYSPKSSLIHSISFIPIPFTSFLECSLRVVRRSSFEFNLRQVWIIPTLDCCSLGRWNGRMHSMIKRSVYCKSAHQERNLRRGKNSYESNMWADSEAENNFNVITGRR